MNSFNQTRLWPVLLSNRTLTVAGKEYFLGHLHSFGFDLVIPASGKYAEQVIPIHVEFSSHCISIGPKDDEKEFDFSEIGHDHLIIDHRRKNRKFCPVRYEWSRRLPRLVGEIGEMKCYFAKYENWMIISGIDHEGCTVDYEVFFQLTKMGSKLKLFIESAYVRLPGEQGPGTPSDKSSIVRFKVIAAKRMRNEPIRRPPRR